MNNLDLLAVKVKEAVKKIETLRMENNHLSSELEVMHLKLKDISDVKKENARLTKDQAQLKTRLEKLNTKLEKLLSTELILTN